MKWLAAIIAVVVQVLVAILAKRSRSTAEDGRRQPELRDRLRSKVRKTWKLGIVILIVVLLLPGCGTRTIYVPSGEPVRLRETVRNAKVWVLDADGQPVAGVMDLPEGWYVLSMPEQE